MLVIAQELDLLLGRDMQHMNAFSGFMREFDEALGRRQRRGLVAPNRMRARIAIYAQVFAVVEAILVLGMKRGTTPDHFKNPSQAFVILDQQRAGRRTDEYLDAGTAGRPLQFRQISHILAGTADKEGKIAMHAVTAALQLVGEGLRVDGQGIGVRHFEHGRHATHHRAARPGFEILLMGQARFTKMHLRIHHAGQDVQASTIDDLSRGGLS